MEAAGERFFRGQADLLSDQERNASRHRRRRSDQELEDRRPLRPRTDAVGFRLRRHNTTCHPGCSCACHKQSRSTTPALMNRVLGQLFIGYAGIPLLRPQCDSTRCEKRTLSHVDLEYWFPTGVFWSQIVRFHYAYQAHLGPQFYLSTLRRVPDNAHAVAFALGGNIDGLKDLFRRGLASPKDVSETRGYSLLRVSHRCSLLLGIH